jgi:short-subunit dehydrogenase
VVVTAGLFAPQEQLEADPELRRRLLEVDFVRTVEFCEAARERLLASGGGTLCVFGSVAGDRGRKPVVLYGAAKAGLAAYLEGLDHRFHSRGLRVITVKPGFVRTGMTAGLPEPPFAGEPDEVAARVVEAIDRGWPVVYAPPIWALVMLAVRHLPRFLMRRLGFCLRRRRFASHARPAASCLLLIAAGYCRAGRPHRARAVSAARRRQR